MLTYPLAVIVWGLDRVLLAWTSGDRSRVSAQLAVCSVLVGAVAALFGATAVAKLTNTTTGDHPLPLAATVVTATTAVALMVASTRLARSQRMVSSGR